MSEAEYKTSLIPERESAAVSFLYCTIPGRLLLKLLVKPSVSKLAGFFMNRRVSTIFVKSFIKRNNIQMEEYVETEYKSFNDFFTRQVKKEHRPLPTGAADFFAPCDGKLTAYTITDDSKFKIKNSVYDVFDMLDDKTPACEYINGVCLIFRLTPDDYHRFFYIDNGEIEYHKKIKGVLHTVRPISHARFKVYSQNAREFTVMRTEHFGKVIQLEIGALFVGRIINHSTSGPFFRGEEKGMFQFGGSTVIILLQKDTVVIDDAIFTNTRRNEETVVRMGQKIGKGF